MYPAGLTTTLTAFWSFGASAFAAMKSANIF
jgi:hypothetical protein